MKCACPRRAGTTCSLSDDWMTDRGPRESLGTYLRHALPVVRSDARLFLVGHDLYRVQWPRQSLDGRTALLRCLELLLGAYPHDREVAPAHRPAYGSKSHTLSGCCDRLHQGPRVDHHALNLASCHKVGQGLSSAGCLVAAPYGTLVGSGQP